jgi:hypothetical protein
MGRSGVILKERIPNMKTYIVSYELKNASGDTALIAAIGKHDHCRIHATAWGIRTDADAAALFDELRATLDPADILFITESAHNTAWVSIPEAEANWLKNFA